jgi:predicted MFS family arabinose efflux permease
MKRIATLYFNAYSGLAPSTWLLSLVMLVNRCGTMVLPFMTLYLTQSKGVSLSKAGFVVALFGLGAICGGFVGGKLTDKFNFYFIQLFTLLGGGIMFLILGQMQSYTAICICTFILSFVNESFRPANAAAVAHYSKDENRTRSYSLNRLSINLGWACGGAFGGFIASYNYHLLFWIDGITNLIAALLLWAFLAPSKNKATARKKEQSEVPAVSAYKDKQYIFFIVLTTMYAYCFFQIFSTMPVYFKRDLGLSEFYIGAVMAFNGFIIAVFEMVVIHNLEGRKPPLYFIAPGTILVALSYVVFNLFTGGLWLAVLSTIIVTVGEILTMPFMNTFWSGRGTAANRGQYAGLYTVAWSTAQVLGPATGSQIADRFGFTFLWWFIGGVCLLAALGFRLLLIAVNRKTKFSGGVTN